MDLEKLDATLREMGLKPEDAEFKRLMAAAVPVEKEVETPEERETETVDKATADAVDEAASARVAQAAAEADAGELRSLLDDARGEITVLSERIGDLDGFRTNFEARYGVLTSDEDEAGARAGEAEVDAPLASKDEFKEASNYELSVGLFRSVCSRWAARHGDAPIPEGAAPTARSLAFVRRAQGTALPGEAPAFR
jgi:hypothetical protein